MDRKLVKYFPYIMVLFGVVARLLPHPANFVPITAMALFGGMYFNKRFGMLVPLLAIFVSDIFIGFYGVGMVFVYGSFLLVGIIGNYLRANKSFKNVLGGTLLGSFLFYIITNYGVWLTSSMYPPTFAGLMQSYYMAIPFFRNSLLGDMFYTGVLVGGYELLTLKVFSKVESLAPARD